MRTSRKNCQLPRKSQDNLTHHVIVTPLISQVRIRFFCCIEKLFISLAGGYTNGYDSSDYDDEDDDDDDLGKKFVIYFLMHCEIFDEHRKWQPLKMSEHYFMAAGAE